MKSEQLESFPVWPSKTSLLRKAESGISRECFDARAKDERITGDFYMFFE